MRGRFFCHWVNLVMDVVKRWVAGLLLLSTLPEVCVMQLVQPLTTGLANIHITMIPKNMAVYSLCFMIYTVAREHCIGANDIMIVPTGLKIRPLPAVVMM